jgi:hypothetical protein
MTQRLATRHFWPTERVALSLAALCSVGLVVLAATTPFYTSSVSTQSDSGSVVTRSTSATLVQVNGSGVVGFVAIPLLITLAVVGILWMRGIERGAGAIAWTAVTLLSVVTLAGMLTIGPLMMPVAASLVTACGVRQVRRQQG